MDHGAREYDCGYRGTLRADNRLGMYRVVALYPVHTVYTTRSIYRKLSLTGRRDNDISLLAERGSAHECNRLW